MPHTDAIYNIRPEPVSRSVLRAEFARKHKGQTHLYAITDGEAIKFGSAWDVDKRLESLQCANSRKLVCLGSILAKKGTEPAVHKALWYQRIRGEWFSVCQLSMSMVDLYRRGEPDALYNYLDNFFQASNYLPRDRCTQRK